jgi:hypothetical protein
MVIANLDFGALSGTAKRIAPCVWYCVKFGGRKQECNKPPCLVTPCVIEGCGPEELPARFCCQGDGCPGDSTQEADCLPLVLVTTITKLATQWHVNITLDGTTVFDGTSTDIPQTAATPTGKNCYDSSTILNTIPPCVLTTNPWLPSCSAYNPSSTVVERRTFPGAGCVHISCDPCNCETSCNCNPNCCCAAPSAACKLPYGPGVWSVTWSASCTNAGCRPCCFGGCTVPAQCDCFMHWYSDCTWDPVQLTFPTACNVPAYGMVCPALGSGTESLCPSGYGASNFRKNFFTCQQGAATMIWHRNTSVSFDPCSGTWSFGTSAICCCDKFGDHLPSLGGSFQGVKGCPKSISGTVLNPSGVCITNCGAAANTSSCCCNPRIESTENCTVQTGTLTFSVTVPQGTGLSLPGGVSVPATSTLMAEECTGCPGDPPEICTNTLCDGLVL